MRSPSTAKPRDGRQRFGGAGLLVSGGGREPGDEGCRTCDVEALRRSPVPRSGSRPTVPPLRQYRPPARSRKPCRRDIGAAPRVGMALAEDEVTICSLYALPGSNSCPTSRDPALFAGATGSTATTVDDERPQHLSDLVGSSSNSFEAGRCWPAGHDLKCTATTPRPSSPLTTRPVSTSLPSALATCADPRPVAATIASTCAAPSSTAATTLRRCVSASRPTNAVASSSATAQYPRSGYTAPWRCLPWANRRMLVVMRSESSGSSISSVAPMCGVMMQLGKVHSG